MKRRRENSASCSNKCQTMTTDEDLPKSVNYWMTNESKHDCFFNVGPESGPIERIGAVKVILLGHSEVLQKMLDESALAETGDIRIPDSDPETFKNWLKCVYGGTKIVLRKLPYEKSLKLVYLSDKYLMSELKEKICSCILQLHDPLCIDKAVTALSHVESLENTSLSAAISRMIKNHTDSFLGHKRFLDLDTNGVVFIAKQEKISTTEINIWNAVLRWAKKKISPSEKSGDEESDGSVSDESEVDENGVSRSKSLRSYLKRVLKYVNFCTMISDDFNTFVVPSGVLTPEEIAQICISIGTKTRSFELDVKGELSAEIVSRYVCPRHNLRFIHTLDNINTVSSYKESAKHRCGKYKWWIVLVFFNNQENTNIYLYCSSANGASSWKCYASGYIEILNHIDETRCSRQSFYHKELSDRDVNIAYSGLNSFPSLKYLRNIENGFVKNNSIKVAVQVEVDF